MPLCSTSFIPPVPPSLACLANTAPSIWFGWYHSHLYVWSFACLANTAPSIDPAVGADLLRTPPIDRPSYASISRNGVGYSVGARAAGSGWEGLYGRPRPVPLAHLLEEHDHSPTHGRP